MNIFTGGGHARRLLMWFALLAPSFVPEGSFAGGGACVGMVIEAEYGAIVDEGTLGRAHDQTFPEGNVTSWLVAKRCSNNQALCTSDDDCGAGDCVATCDCQGDSSCDLTGPAGGRKCLNNFADCTTNADCPSSAACVSYLGAPLPVTWAETPFCLVTHFEGTASGTFDAGSGDLSLSATLRRRIFSGEATAMPCPRCGSPDQNPMVGGEFVCEDGQYPGAACVVEAVHPYFGGTSTDCPPALANALTGAGSLFPLRDLGTDSKTKTARLPCAQFGFTGNPLSPGSNPKCTDDPGGPVCTSNADCRRCSGNASIKCTSDDDCTGNGTCNEEDESPVTCGFWCHCGFCNGSASAPCFDDTDCTDGQTCQKGTGTGAQANLPQQRPNDCSADGYICGTEEAERCESSIVGSCTEAPFRSCATNTDCESFNAGTCFRAGKPCFPAQIDRYGSASPLGSYCAIENKSCSSNADCMLGGDSCVSDSTHPQLAALYCLPATSAGVINSAVGLTGPAGVTIPSFAKVCRCSGSEPGCENVCGLTSDCGNEIVEEGEQCDGGPCCNLNCTFAGTTQQCRATAGSCDTAEMCTGTSAACPNDTLKSSVTTCRSSAGVCDAAELCTGASPTCPADVMAPSSTTCRASTGICDVAEKCPGNSAACPVDGFASTATTCRGSAGICDVAETCPGNSATCPGDGFASTATTCRASSGTCDAAESCSGTAATCPVNAAAPDGTECNDGNACTSSDECSGGSCTGTPIPECGAECGNGTVEGSEACDDGNATFTIGEYCGVDCVLIPCGKPTNGSGELPKTSDALFVLRTAVDQVDCSPRVCSPDGNQTILTSDALLVLRKAVGQPVNLNCPTQ